MLRRFATAVAVLTTVALISSATVTARADTGTNPGEIVLPPTYGTALPRVAPVLGSTEALTWTANAFSSTDPADLRYDLYGGTQHGTAGVGISLYTYLNGTQLAFKTPEGGSAAVDLRTGERRGLTDQYVGNSNLAAATGNGWIDANNGALVLHTYDYSSSALPKPHIDNNDDSSVSSSVLAADPRGAVISSAGTQGDQSVAQNVSYLDFATATFTTLHSGPGGYLVAAQIDGDNVMWADGTALNWFNRADPATVHTATAPTEIHAFVENAGNVAYTQRIVQNGRFAYLLFAGPLAGPWHAITGKPMGETVLPAPNGTLAVVAGSTVTDYGVYGFTADAKTLGAPLLNFGPGAPYGIGASAGRLVTLTPSKQPDADETPVDSDATADDVSAGKQSVLAHSLQLTTPPDLSGGHAAYLHYGTYPAVDAVVMDSAREIARYSVPNALNLKLSGQRLLWDDGTHAKIIDLDTGASTAVPYTRAIYGDELLYAKPDGGIHLRNLSTGAERQLRAPGAPLGAINGSDPNFTELWIAGDWVVWMFSGNLIGTIYPAETVAMNTVTGNRVDLTQQIGVNPLLTWNVQVVDGVVAWINQSDQSVHVTDLSAGTTRTVGTAHRYYSNRHWLALSDEFVAWVSTDDTTHLLPLGPAADGAADYLGAVAPEAFSPDVSSGYKPQIDVSRPLTSWTMTIAAAPTTHGASEALLAGKTLQTLKGSAKNGAVRPSWNGRTSAGKKVPDGVYTWTLTGDGIGGKLATEHGTFRVDTVAPTPKLRAPGTARTKGVALSWSSDDKTARYTVTVSLGTKGKNGKITWAKAVRWLSATTAKKDTYQTKKGLPTLKSGRYYRFSVTATDPAGNHRATTGTTRIR